MRIRAGIPSEKCNYSIMSLKSYRKSDLLKEIENFIIKSNLTYGVEDETGDYFFSLTSKSGNQFTFDICDGYVEFYGDSNHDLIDYSEAVYNERTIELIKSYLNS